MRPINLGALEILSLLIVVSHIFLAIEDTARYAGLLLAPAEFFDLQPRLFLPFVQKKAYYAVVGENCVQCCETRHLSSNLSNFEKNP